MSVTAMFLFSGFLRSASESVHINFSGAGEIESASKLIDIADEFHKQYSFKDINLPGIFQYEVAEEFGEFIAESNLYKHDHPDSYYVDMMITFTDVWLFRNNVTPKSMMKRTG